MRQFAYKGLDWKAVDIDETHRKVKIYVSAFNNKDSDGDIIVPGAYKKTIAERGPSGSKRIKHLRDHWDLIGKPEEMIEDTKGLLVTSVLSNSTQGLNTIEDYKLDLLEHSIGYEVIKFEEDRDENTRWLYELKLWEYSSVTWGANEETPLVDMKALSSEDALEEINKRMDKLTRALKKGNYTDDYFEQLELQLIYLKKSYNDLLDSLVKPVVKTTSNEPDLKELANLFDNFKSKVKNGRR